MELFEKIDFYLFIVAVLMAAGAVIYSYLSANGTLWRKGLDAVNNRLDGVVKDQETQAKDIERNREKIHDLNISEEIGKIHSRINDVANTSYEQAGQMKQINSTLSIIQQHLIGR